MNKFYYYSRSHNTAKQRQQHLRQIYSNMTSRNTTSYQRKVTASLVSEMHNF